jgi:nicotinamidase-related amidase
MSGRTTATGPQISRLPPEHFGDCCSPKELLALSEYVLVGPQSWTIKRPGRRPALLLVDVQNNVFGSDVPLEDAVIDSRMTIGARAHSALPHLRRLLDAARRAEIPVLYTMLIPKGESASDKAFRVYPDLEPAPGDAIVKKRHASAFFETDLRERLDAAAIDTLIIVGSTTSGCVRATAVDAHQIGWSAVVPVEAVFDRVELSHRLSLFDLWLKYATVAEADEVVGFLIATGRSSG